MAYTEKLDNPFNPKVQDYRSESPSLSQVMNRAINSALLRLHTWLPASVTRVSSAQRVNIQPLLQYRTVDPTGSSPTGIVKTLPEVQNVMVLMTRGANYSIKVPVQVGDTGIALFCERSLDVWSVQGGTQDPQDTRHHDLTDAVFIPGLYPFNDQVSDSTTDLVLTNGEAQIRLEAAGKFKIQNEQQELIDNLVNLVSILKTASTVAGGPFVPSVVSDLGDIEDNLNSLKG